MFNCCNCYSSQTQTFNPFDNSFLDSDARLQSLKYESTLYETAYLVSCVALMIIAVSVVFYVSSLAAPLWAIILTGALELFAIKLIFDYSLSDLELYATEVSEKFLYEKEIIDLTEALLTKAKAEKSHDKTPFYKSKAAEYGVRVDQPALYTLIENRYRELYSNRYAPDYLIQELGRPALQYLAPMIARAQKCHHVALTLLEEIYITFHKVPEGAKENPYREYIAQLDEQSNNPANVINRVRQKVRSFEAIHALKWKQYLENRFKEIFTAYVLENPIHSGDIKKVGFFPTDTPLIDYLLESTDKTRNLLFAFKPHYKEITRDQFEEKHKEAFINAIDAAIIQMHDNPRGDALFEIHIDADKRVLLETSAKSISDHARINIAKLLDELSRDFTWEDPNMNMDEMREFAERNYERLFCDPRMQAAICPIVNKYYIDQLRTYDLTSLRGRIAKALLTESGTELTDDLAPLNATASSVGLREDLFSQARIAACKRAVGGIDKASIRRILENKDFGKVIDEIELAYLLSN